MMKLSISRCSMCSKTRLVDMIDEKWICFACKQTHGIHNAGKASKEQREITAS